MAGSMKIGKLVVLQNGCWRNIASITMSARVGRSGFSQCLTVVHPCLRSGSHRWNIGDSLCLSAEGLPLWCRTLPVVTWPWNTVRANKGLQVGFSLLGLNFCGPGFEFDDELLEIWVGAEIPQIIVAHQAVAVFIPAVDSFM
jgi:hypothetical protein